MDNINDLPIEVLTIILAHFGLRNLLKKYQMVCKHWRKVINDSVLPNIDTFWLKLCDRRDPEFAGERVICIIKSFDAKRYPAELGLIKPFENSKMNDVIVDLPFLSRRAKNVEINFNGCIRETDYFRWLINFQQINVFCLNLHRANGAQLIDWEHTIAGFSCNLQEFRLAVSYLSSELFPNAYPKFINNVLSSCQNLQVFGLEENGVRCSLNIWNNSPCLPRLKKFLWSNDANYDNYLHPVGYLASIFTFLVKCSDDLQEVSISSTTSEHEQESAVNDANFRFIFQQFAVKKPIDTLSFQWVGPQLVNLPTLDDFRHMKRLTIKSNLSTLVFNNSLALRLEQLIFANFTLYSDDALVSDALSNGMPNLLDLGVFVWEFVVTPLSFAEMIIVKCPKLEIFNFYAIRNFDGIGEFREEFLNHIRRLLAVSVPKRVLKIGTLYLA